MPTPLTFDDVLRPALSFPGVEAGTSYGTPAFRVRGKFLGRLHQDGDSLVLRMDFDTREFLTRTSPSIYHFTDHYRDYPAVLIRFAAIDRDELAERIEEAWRGYAPKRLIAEYDARA